MPNICGGDQFHPAYYPPEADRIEKSKNEFMIGNDYYIIDEENGTYRWETLVGWSGQASLKYIPKEILAVWEKKKKSLQQQVVIEEE